MAQIGFLEQHLPHRPQSYWPCLTPVLNSFVLLSPYSYIIEQIKLFKQTTELMLYGLIERNYPPIPPLCIFRITGFV